MGSFYSLLHMKTESVSKLSYTRDAYYLFYGFLKDLKVFMLGEGI